MKYVDSSASFEKIGRGGSTESRQTVGKGRVKLYLPGGYLLKVKLQVGALSKKSCRRGESLVVLPKVVGCSGTFL